MAPSERPSQRKKTSRKRQNYGLRVMPWRFKIRNSDDGRAIVIGKLVPASKHAKRLSQEVLYANLGSQIGSKGITRVGFFQDSDGKHLAIYTVYVPKEHRGRGYASQMFDKAIDLAEREGAKTAHITIANMPESPMRTILEKRRFNIASQTAGG